MITRQSDKQRYLGNNRGQGLVEYTLIMTLAVFLLWVAIRDVRLDQALTDLWGIVSGTVSGASTPGSFPDSGSGGSGGGSGGSGGGSGGSGGGSGGSGGGSGQNADEEASNSNAYNFTMQRETVPESENSGNRASSGGGKNSGAQEGVKSSETADGISSYGNAGPEQDIAPISVGWFMVLSVLLFVPYLVWVIVKAVRKSEVSYQNLEADQIVAKIKD